MLTPPKRRWHKPQSLDDQGTIYLTPEAHARMKARLARLKAQVPALAEDASEAAALGDRSDNAAYKEAKGLLRRTNRQILVLEDQLTRVEEIAASHTNAAIALGSTVVLASLSGDRTAHAHPPATSSHNVTRTYRILGPFEADPAKGIISYKSPLGAALMGRHVGDVVHITIGDSPRSYRILELR